jgi:hypothetical protein
MWSVGLDYTRPDRNFLIRYSSVKSTVTSSGVEMRSVGYDYAQPDMKFEFVTQGKNHCHIEQSRDV